MGSPNITKLFIPYVSAATSSEPADIRIATISKQARPS